MAETRFANSHRKIISSLQQRAIASHSVGFPGVSRADAPFPILFEALFSQKKVFEPDETLLFERGIVRVIFHNLIIVK